MLAVGRPAALFAPAIQEYERRAARYWPLEVIEVRAVKGTAGWTDEQLRAEESKRLLARVPSSVELIVMTRSGGDAWSSTRLARYLGELAVQGSEGVAFLIGGPLGLSDHAVRAADRRMRLSTFTLPHDLARLLLAEQLYRAGTILRGEPYHKAAE